MSDGACRRPAARRAELAGLAALRARRRASRLAGISVFDGFYQVYVTALLGGLAILLVSGWVGDAALDPDQVDRLLADGPAVLGLVAALVLAVGLRSGSRGGPLALEAAEVQHVLLAPVPRRAALRGPALRQLRFLTFVAVVAGAVAGQLAARRLPGNPAGWVACTAGWAALIVALGLGAAWLSAGHRMPHALATCAGAVVLGWAAADVAGLGPTAPTTHLGRLALWPLRFEVSAAIAAAAALVVLALGLAACGGLSLELAQRRSVLVGQIRFAATMRDLRTVIVLRRQLAQERPRHRPWLPTRRRGGRTCVVLRSWRSLMRTPGSRLGRMAALGAVAAVAARGVWSGTTPLVVVAGLASYLAALDAVEPLAQEIDHPTVVDLAPVAPGEILARLLVVPAMTMLAVGAVGFCAIALTEPSAEGLAVAALTLVPAALASAAGAAISVVRSAASDDADTASFLPPEALGMRAILQAAGPPLVATLGFLPVLGAARALSRATDPVQAAASSMLVPLVAAAAVVGWIRWRDDMHASWDASMEGARRSGPGGG